MKKEKKKEKNVRFQWMHDAFLFCLVLCYFLLACSCCPHYAIPNQKRPDCQVKRHRRSNEAPLKGGPNGHV